MLKKKPAGSGGHGHPVVRWSATNLEDAGRRGHHKDGEAPQEVQKEVWAKMRHDLLPLFAAVDVVGALRQISLEPEEIYILVLLRRLPVIALSQNIIRLAPFQVVEDKSQEF